MYIHAHCLVIYRSVKKCTIRVSLGKGIMENFHLLYYTFMYFNFYDQEKKFVLLALCLSKASPCLYKYLAFLGYSKVSHSIDTKR